MKRSLIIRPLLPVLATLFYITCLLQWMWASLPYLPYILTHLEMWQTPTRQPEVDTVVQMTPVAQPSIVVMIFIVAVVILVIVATVYALIKLPSSISKSGDVVAKAATKRIIPVVTRHKPLPEKKRRQLTARVLFDVKLALCTLPIVATALAYNISSELPYDITMMIAAGLGIVALALLSAQTLAEKIAGRLTAA